MKRLLLLLLLLAPLASAQVFNDVVTNSRGQPIAGASYTVYNYVAPTGSNTPCNPITGTAATLYTDPSLGTPLSSNVLTSDQLGRVIVYAAPANYCVSIIGYNIQSYNYPIEVGGAGGGGGTPSGALGETQIYGSGAVFAGAPDTLDASVFTGADACAQISAAIATLPAGGGTIDARSLTTAVLSTTCASTITFDRFVRLLLPVGVLKSSACPILSNTSAQGVVIQGSSWDYTYPGSGYGSVIESHGACEAFSDSGSTNMIIRDVDFNGNSTGTIGFFGPATRGGQFINTRFRTFTQTGAFFGGLNNYFNSLDLSANGGDGIVVNGDSVMEGNTGIYGNIGTGLQVLAGGFRGSNINSADNGLHNIWIAGAALATSRANLTQIIQPYVIRPGSGNAGTFYFYAANVGGTTGSGTPTWCQTQGCIVTDGTVKWYNVGLLGGITLPSAGITFLNNPYVGDAGAQTVSTYPSFQASNILIDGQLITFPFCDNVHVLGVHIQQGLFLQANTDGLHINNCENVEVSGGTISGESYNPATATPDRGGLILNNVATSTFSNLDLEYNTKSAIQVTNVSEHNQFVNISINNDVGNATTSPFTYGVYFDATSISNRVTNLSIQGRSTNAHGVFGSSGGANFLSDYQSSGTNSGTLAFDSLTDIVADNVYNRDGTYPYETDIGTTRAFQIDNAGIVHLPQGFIQPGSSSGLIQFITQASFSNYGWDWPTSAGTVGQCLLSGGGGGFPMTWGACTGGITGLTIQSGGTPVGTISSTATLNFRNNLAVGLSGSTYTIDASGSGGGGSNNPAPQYDIGVYVNPGTSSTIGGSGITTDSSLNNLFAAGNITAGDPSIGPYCTMGTQFACYSVPGTLQPLSLLGSAIASSPCGTGQVGWNVSAGLTVDNCLNGVNLGANVIWLSGVANTGDAYTATAGGITAYDAKALYCFLPSASNSGTSPSLNIDSIGVINLKAHNGAAAVAAEFASGHVACVGYNGSQFEDTSGGGSGTLTALDQIQNPSGGHTISSANNAQIWQWHLTGLNTVGMTFSESSASTATGTPFLAQYTTAAGSTATPFRVANALTGAQTLPTFIISPNWSTSGVATGILENVVGSGSGAGSKLIDLQVAGTSKFKADTLGMATYSATIDNGTTFTTDGGCSEDTLVGGATAGSVISRTSGACTFTVTMGGGGVAAPNAWECSVHDKTTFANVIGEEAPASGPTTKIRFTGTTVTGDVISFSCTGY